MAIANGQALGSFLQSEARCYRLHVWHLGSRQKHDHRGMLERDRVLRWLPPRGGAAVCPSRAAHVLASYMQAGRRDNASNHLARHPQGRLSEDRWMLVEPGLAAHLCRPRGERSRRRRPLPRLGRGPLRVAARRGALRALFPNCELVQ